MFEHLFDPKFDDLDDLDVSQTLSAQANTTAWLKEIGAVDGEEVKEAHKNAARAAFAAVTDPQLPPEKQKEALMALKVPQAVRHISEMLNAYDWDFVSRAKEIRGYIVAGLMEETKHPDARVRLTAYKALGNITEVGAFTERIEIKKVDVPHTELLDDIKKYLVLPAETTEVSDTQPKT